MSTTDAQEMTCKELVELVTDYLEGALPPATRARFDEHLAGCPFCTTYLEQMRQTVKTLGALPDASIPPAALDALLGHFRKWR
ncbi:MAG TPA: zf-HC2 domain-containing protein [Gemmatimonadaceae bacterium]|nr:zf-HC2 domain-containing protein [Gemmatimonadaceae bacterium]